ncbi:MAG: SDR family oxidoreductase [Zoogloeaceae bacterium]|jgi:NAD(P)-dependent dehydrogenase (short-subunit alcohol dehydrogenase family)|nr:SDR family oxidoreductase [Zoogloeaceae bacterium]
MSTPDFPDAFTLIGKTILVTGASSGIGAATAALCARLGATLVINGRDRERLDSTLAGLVPAQVGEHIAVAGDLDFPETRNALLEACPAYDGMAYCAGISALAPFRMLSEKHLQQMLSADFLAPVLLAQQLLSKRRFRHGASLVFISTVGTHIKSVAGAALHAAKAALEVAVCTLALEHARQGIRANCIAPGYTQTPMLEKLAVVGGNLADSMAMAPLGVILPEDIAAAVAYHLSDASRWITRSTLKIDSGLTLRFRP